MKYIVVSLGLFIISFLNFYIPVYKYFDFFFSPLQFGLSNTAIAINDFARFYGNLGDIRRENVKLIEDKIILESRVTELTRLEDENKFLRSQLQLEQELPAEKNMVLANVMGNPLDLSSATVVIDKGRLHKVTVGDNVLVGRYLVGKVISTGSIKSVVELIASPNTSVAVYNVNSPQKTEALAVGQHGVSVKIEKILPSERLYAGDIFVSSGKDGVYIPGLYVGKVLEISSDPSQPLKSASVQTILDIERLDRVLVLVQL